MRLLPSPVADLLAARRGRVARVLVWIKAKNRSTGLAEPLGLWSGGDHQDFVIGGKARTYFGAGAMIDMDPLTSDIGLTVRRYVLNLSPIVPEVQQIIRGYDPRLAAVQIHVADFDPDTHSLLASPVRVFKGWIDTVHISEPAPDGEASCEVALLSAAQALTRTLPRKRSDQTLRARAPGDAFRKYADISGSVETVWGEKRGKAPAGTVVAAETPDSSGHG